MEEKVILKQKSDGVELVFPGGTSTEKVNQKMSECAGGSCTCCTNDFREKVLSFEILKDRITPVVKITGNITLSEIERNLEICHPENLLGK